MDQVDASFVADVSISDEESTSDDEGSFFQTMNGSPFNMSARFVTSLTDKEFIQVKKQLSSDLRIGSAVHIGEKHSLALGSQEITPTQVVSNMGCPVVNTTITPIHFSPTELLTARELGACGGAPRHTRLRDSLFSKLDLHAGHRIRWPLAQTFQEHIQGNLWSVSSLGLESSHRHHSGCVNALNFSNSGRLIVSGSDDQRIAITNLHTGELQTRFHSGHDLNVFQVKFVPESNDLQIVTSARDAMVRLASLHEDGRVVTSTRLLAAHDGPCHKLAFVADSPHVLLSAGEDGCVYSIDLREPKATLLLNLPLSSFYSISTNPVRTAEFCVCGKSESVVRVFDRRYLNDNIQHGFLQSFAPPHLKPKKRITASNSRSEDAEEKRRRRGANNDEDEENADIHMSSITSRVSRRFQNLLTGFTAANGREVVGLRRRASFTASPTERREVHVASRLDPLLDHQPSKFNITAAVYSAQGEAILASFNDEDIYLFDSRNDALPPIHAYRGHRNMVTVKGVSFFGPNSEYIVSGSDDGFVYIWDRHSEGIVQWLCADMNGSVNVIEPHPNLPVIATSGIDYDFKIWSPRPRGPSVVATPEDWLPRLKSGEMGVPPIFDPDSMVKSMNRLRRSPLADRLFGLNSFPSRKSSKAIKLKKNKAEELSLELDWSSQMSLSSEETAIDSTANQSIIEPEIHVYKSTTRKRRNSPQTSLQEEEEKETEDPELKLLSVEERSRKRYKTQPLLKPSSINTRVSVHAPQSVLPFNIRDLQLRVATNWIERARESQSFSSEMQLLSALASIASSRIDFREIVQAGWDQVEDDDDENEEEDNRLGEVLPTTVDSAFPFVRGSSTSQTLSESSDVGILTAQPEEPSSDTTSSSSSSSASSSSSDTDDANVDDYLDYVD